MTNRSILRHFGRVLATGTALLPVAASAHPGGHVFGHGESFLNGFLHPILGSDHLVAMLAIGLWAAYLGGRAVVGVPLAFLGMMIAGSLLGYAGVVLPAVDQTIGVSLVVVGLLICLLAKMPHSVAAFIVGLFASFHGYAHGAEMPDVANPLLYGAGFFTATAALLALGGAIGLASRGTVPATAIRAAGAAVAVFGIATLTGQVG